MWTTLLPHQKKGQKLKPSDVLKFPWEEQRKNKVLSKEEKERLAAEIWAKVDAKKNG